MTGATELVDDQGAGIDTPVSNAPPAGPTYATRVASQADGDEQTFDAQCACGFTSSGWNAKDLASHRLDEHTAEHSTGEPMRELVEFREEHGLNGATVTHIDFTDAEG